MKVKLIDDCIEYRGFFSLRRMTIEHELYGGRMSPAVVREVLERSDVAAAVLFDPKLDKVVMVEQFRAGAYAAAQPPWVIDIVAGRIDGDQSPEEAIVREIGEETGLKAIELSFIGCYFTAPHLSSERVHLYCAQVDASEVTGTHGLAEEGENIRPLVLERAKAIQLFQSHTVSLWAGLALGWIAGHPSLIAP